jgi:hypothetical protein
MRLVAFLLGLLALGPLASPAQTPGNVWHLPRNAEPSGATMRNPVAGILPGAAVTLYNGSYSLDGNQSGGWLVYRKAGVPAWSMLDLVFDSQSGNNKYWKATLPANTFSAGDMVEYYFRIGFSDRGPTCIYGTDTTSHRTLLETTAQAAPYRFRVTLPWPGGTTSGYPSHPPERIHHWKEEAVIGNGYMTAMLDQNGTLYDLYYPSAGNRQGVSTANEGYRGPEEFPFCTALTPAANGQMNVLAGMGGLGLGGSIYWLKNAGGEYTDIQQSYVKDNNVVRTLQRLTAPGNSIQVVQYDFCPVPAALPVVSGSGRTNYGVYLKRVLLTNLEATPRTVDFYYDVNFNVNGGNGHDVMYYDTLGGRNTMVAYDNTAREVSGAGCAADGNAVEYKPASYGGNYVKQRSLYFGTALKLVTNAITGAGAPADAAWREHTATDHHEGWIAKRVVLPPGDEVELNVIIVGSWDDIAGATGTHDYWGRPLVDWFYTNRLATAQALTEAYWSDWLAQGVTVDLPGTAYDDLFKRSLLASALHIDAATGSIIAGMHNGAYPFVWPRDGIYAAISLARVGHLSEAEGFYRWLRDKAYRDFDSGIGDKGFFYQKYTTDGYQIWTSPQVDETAGVPWGAYYYYLITGDTGFLSDYWNLIYSSARASSETSAIDSRLNYNATFHLMDGNNVWEDAFGLFLYSNASVVRGLRDAASIADLLGQTGWASAFRTRADAIKSGLDARLDARVEPADISHLGLVHPFEVYSATDPRMTNMIEWIHGRQNSGGHFDNLVETTGDIAGLVRRYNHSVNGGIDNYWNGGPWFLSTAWYGQYYTRWQDALPGTTFSDLSREKLDLMIAKLGPMGLGAEQIAASTALQKYPGFWLQTAWPSVWESHSTFLDQLMLFLDYRPQTNRASFAPKLPTGWGSMTYSNLLYRGQRFDVVVTDTAASTRADVTLRTSGPLAVEFFLRIPAGQPPAIVVVDTNFFVPTPADYDLTTGRVRVSASLSGSSSVWPLFVTFGAADTDDDGLPDTWEAAKGLNPLSAVGEDGGNGDPDGDGLSNAHELVAGSDPRDAASVFKILSQSPAGSTITWASVVGKQYRVHATAELGSAFSPVSGLLTATEATTSYTEPLPGPGVRYYRVEVLP